MEFKEIDITFRNDSPFIFFIYGEDEELLYIGYTEDINKKAFIFPFEYRKITGYFFPFRPAVQDEVDSLILTRKPKYCKPRFGMKMSNLKEWVKSKTGIKFSRKEWKQIVSEINPGDIYIFENEAYITQLGREQLLLEIDIDDNGTRNL